MTENTKIFVEKLGIDNTRIPIHITDDNMPVMSEPYCLITPTYGGGASLNDNPSENNRPVPPQVRKFLEHKNNANFMKAVIASGNRNFFTDYCLAGKVIKKKFGVPFVWAFELQGNERDVSIVREGLKDFKIN